MDNHDNMMGNSKVYLEIQSNFINETNKQIKQIVKQISASSQLR